MWHKLALLALLALTPALALAQDSEDEEEEEIDLDDALDLLRDSNEGDEEGRLEEPDDLLFEDDEEPPDDLEPIEILDEEDLLEDDAEEEAVGGADNAATYRAYQDKVRDLDADEEVIAWERYLAKYPDTEFRDRIQDRIDVLMEGIYGERIDSGGRVVDADEQEIRFAQALLLENINPRTRLQVGFEWGLPDYMNLYGNYEYQLWREFSVHGGVRRRYTGWSVEAGVHWAFVKAQRTKTLVTLIGDLHFNAEPAFLGLRPQIAVGKIFGDVVHAQIQAGVDFESRDLEGFRVIGGANVTWLASKNVAIFVETNAHAKHLVWDEGNPFSFNIFSFGLKFFPTPGNVKSGDLEANVGASAPYGWNYWMYHFGSVMGQLNYYH
jgi:hypothetical protein